MHDWTTAFDDGLMERLRCCTLCGRHGVKLWGICGTLRLAGAYVLCQRCKDHDGVRQVERLYARRYAAPPGQETARLDDGSGLIRSGSLERKEVR